MKLSAERIIDTALSLLNETGLDGLTTRRLGAALNVRGPALYYYFRDKEDLLGQMAVAIVQKSLAGLSADTDWKDWLSRVAHSIHRTVLGYRDGPQVLSLSAPTDSMRHDVLEAVARPLLQAGFSPEEANETIAILSAFVTGWSTFEQNPPMRALQVSMMDLDHAFAKGVANLIAGFALEHAALSDAR